MGKRVNEAVEQFYDGAAEQEWARMERHKMEFALTTRALAELMPRGVSVLDVGGGPGRYSIHLAQRGHDVTLLDLAAANVALARVKAAEAGVTLRDFVHGDALDLGRFADASFDVVLLMGPLYHLLQDDQRRQAVREALRVLRPGGLLAAAFIGRNAFLIDLLRSEPAALAGYRSVLIDHLLTHGTNTVSADNPGFTDAYFVHPTDIEPWLSGFGLVSRRMMASDPLVQTVEGQVNDLPADSFARWVDVCYRLSTDPTVWGTAEHLLYVGEKPR